jgi:hypothetical protein
VRRATPVSVEESHRPAAAERLNAGSPPTINQPDPLGQRTREGSIALSDLKPMAPHIFRSGRWLPAQCATTIPLSVGQDGRVGA